MVCLACRAELDDCWRWCPECGSTLVVKSRRARPEPPDDGFAVEWRIDSEQQSA
jgi:predicted amidophosphoribosyltransferase